MDNLWLKRQFALQPDKTRTALAEALGLTAPAVSKILAGTRQIKAMEYSAMRRFFGLPVDGETAARPGRDSYILNPLGQALNEQKVPEGDGEAWIMPASFLKGRTGATPDQIRIFTVQETAMQPDFRPGEQVLVDLSDRQPSPGGVFVVSDGLSHIIRQGEYLPHSNPPAVRLSARSGTFEAYTLPLKKAGIVGRVIAKLQWL